MQDAELASAAAELYALSPGDFTAARDERVAQARESGDRDLARAIGALRRPVVSAWLVNRLVRDAADQVDELLALGESLRQADQALAAEQVRELSARSRALVAGLVAEAKQIAEADGRPAGLQVEREVQATLQAALADPGAAAAVRAGCLASPLSYAGLGAGDEGGAVAWQRAPARAKAPAGENAPAGDGAPAGDEAPDGGKARARGKARAGERAPARAGGRRAAETAAEREARLAAAEEDRQARQAAAEAERRAAAERALQAAADAAGAAASDLSEAEAQVTRARAAQESARQQVERLDAELSRAIAAESEANRAVRDAQRAREAAARAADAATRRLARAETAARRLG